MKKFKLDSIVGETLEGGSFTLTYSTKSFDSVDELRAFAESVYLSTYLKSKKVKYSVTFEYVDELPIVDEAEVITRPDANGE